jgi:Domain of unknown function (DUF3291)
LSVWESVEQLADFVYRSDHVAFMRRRREWFERFGTSYMALWWIPAGAIPTVPEAMARIERLNAHGPTPAAFTFKHRFAAPHDAGPVVRSATTRISPREPPYEPAVVEQLEAMTPSGMEPIARFRRSDHIWVRRLTPPSSTLECRCSGRGT